MTVLQKNRSTLKSDESATKLQEFVEKLEHTLSSILPQTQTRLGEAMRYSVLGGGKRIRPSLTYAAGLIFSVSEKDALLVGAAIELVHAYSLVHDDLPCMDDADFRRGKPSCHKAFGEAVAVLVGDALIPLAFQTILSIDASPDVKLKLIERLGQVSGAEGLVEGQMMDLGLEKFPLNEENIIKIQKLKTSTLFEFSVEAGAILGKASSEEHKALKYFGMKFGMVFQMIDDLLDFWGKEDTLGKPTLQDDKKFTYLNYISPEQLYEKILQTHQEACKNLLLFETKATILKEIATLPLIQLREIVSEKLT